MEKMAFSYYRLFPIVILAQTISPHSVWCLGSGASAIMMFVPPKSAKTAVRLANASVVFELSQLYSILVSKWIMGEEAAATGKKPSKEVQQISPWSIEFRTAFTKAGAKLRVLKTRTNLARWEGSIRGAWPVDQYNELNDVETEMLSCLAQVCLQACVIRPVKSTRDSLLAQSTTWIPFGGYALYIKLNF
jgi:Aromatic acid exporter family member 2